MRHSLIGFHDNFAIHPLDGRRVELQVPFMSRPPVKGDRALIVVRDWCGGHSSEIAETDAWNFPQGGRQQWLHDNSVCFNRSHEGAWVGIKYDLSSNTEIILEKAVYATIPSKEIGIGLNFARLHRLGGYGYVGLPDPTKDEKAPEKDGLWKVDLRTGKSELMLSVAAAATITGRSASSKDALHYLTHISPSPSGTSIAFLHRYWLSDGGIQTRLLRMNIKSGSTEVLSEGFLSHFDWMDDERILIWGRPFSALQASRNHPLLQNPIARRLLPVLKPLARRLLGKAETATGAYLLVPPIDGQDDRFASETLTEDGHPSFRPGDRKVLLTDTYPDKSGERQLILFDREKAKITELGKFRQSSQHVDQSQIREAAEGIDPWVLKAFSQKHFAYSRSGIHCDLHPRWRWDGKAVCFDSNHEGTRQVYTMNTPKT